MRVNLKPPKPLPPENPPIPRVRVPPFTPRRFIRKAIQRTCRKHSHPLRLIWMGVGGPGNFVAQLNRFNLQDDYFVNFLANEAHTASG